VAGATKDVLVIVGIGGMGLAIARRCGSGAIVVLADVTDDGLARAATMLEQEGHDVRTQRTDVTDAASVARIAEAASALGNVRSVVHTAGVSPVQAPAATVIAVDLIGVAHMLDAFAAVVAAGGAGVVISSMAGHLGPPLSPDDEQALLETPAAGMQALDCVREAASGDPGLAYSFAKRAAAVLVRAAAVPWGRRGARINSISPGVIATGMGHAELAGPSGEFMKLMVDKSGSGRLGTPDDIAAATDFLLSPQAAFVTGTDLLVDGGAVAAVRSGQL
jgi:NAD(P)-dependent dehydrogenase (short-subunit alcohol dehydrogenase family)